MKIGISTGCLYPALTEHSFDQLIEAGFDLFEVFFNTFSELEPDALERMLYICQKHGAAVVSLHPFTSSFESYLLFSGYERRFLDGVRLYDMYFRSARKLGASMVVLHGMQTVYSSISTQEYIRRFGILAQEAAAFGITLVQENVFRHCSGDLNLLLEMKSRLGSLANFVLDTKQARRCGYQPEEIAIALGSSIRHIHISDCRQDELCLLPGTGCFDFDRFFDILGTSGYSGDCVIEVYGNQENDIPALCKARDYLNRILENNQSLQGGICI